MIQKIIHVTYLNIFVLKHFVLNIFSSITYFLKMNLHTIMPLFLVSIILITLIGANRKMMLTMMTMMWNNGKNDHHSFSNLFCLTIFHDCFKKFLHYVFKSFSSRHFLLGQKNKFTPTVPLSEVAVEKS